MSKIEEIAGKSIGAKLNVVDLRIHVNVLQRHCWASSWLQWMIHKRRSGMSWEMSGTVFHTWMLPFMGAVITLIGHADQLFTYPYFSLIRTNFRPLLATRVQISEDLLYMYRPSKFAYCLKFFLEKVEIHHRTCTKFVGSASRNTSDLTKKLKTDLLLCLVDDMPNSIQHELGRARNSYKSHG